MSSITECYPGRTASRSWAAGAVERLNGHAVMGCLAVVLSTFYVSTSLMRGWIPHDEGQLGQTAERILNGELPHRDFVDPYTGGLGFLSALAFRIGGVRSESIRWMSLPFLGAFAACCYWIASRVARPTVAAGVTFLCAGMTLPVYAAAMPSWYNLFLATYGTAALLRHLETGRRRWLFVAGLCGGLSILVKIVGLYFVAAGLLVVAYREQLQSEGQEGRSMAASALATELLAIFGALAFFFVRREDAVMNVIHFALPFMALTGFVIWSEWRTGRGALGKRLRRAGRLVAPFLLGVLAVVLPFLGAFVRAGAVGQLARGLFVLPLKRLEYSVWPLSSWRLFPLVVPYGGLLAAGLARRQAVGRWTTGWCMAGLGVLLAFSHVDAVYLLVLQALRNHLPVIVAVGVATLVWATLHRRLSKVQRQQLLLLCAMTLFVSLVQYPYSATYYFFFAAPLGVLAALFIVMYQPAAPRAAHLAALVFVVLFLVMRVHRLGPTIAGESYNPDAPRCALGLPRCNLTVRWEQARLYRQVIRAVQAHSPEGSYIYAAVDAPEIYFLAGRKNPTRTLYDFFDEHDAGYNQRILDTLDRYHVPVAVLKQFSEFSPNVDERLRAAIEDRFPNERSFWMRSKGRWIERFRVYWRSGRPAA